MLPCTAFNGGHVLSTSEVSILMRAYETNRKAHTPNFQMPPRVRKTKVCAHVLQCHMLYFTSADAAKDPAASCY
jgi:hypothetical protein